MNRPAVSSDPPSSLVLLGEFLRSRRTRLVPAKTGAEPRRRRRGEGLRREEIASRAGISADWYARIENGGGAVPSIATLKAIAQALELDATDTRYLFELAGITLSPADLAQQSESLAALEHAILDLPHTAAVMFDLFASPLCWNEAADGLFRWSRFDDEFQRNGIVAAFSDPYLQTFFGDDFEAVARRTIGLFRRAYTTSGPTPLARRIFEFGMTQPLFERMWNENSVAEDMSPPGPFYRNIPELGRLCLEFTDLVPLRRQDQIVRLLIPHDEETRAKFDQLADLGKSSRSVFGQAAKKVEG